MKSLPKSGASSDSKEAGWDLNITMVGFDGSRKSRRLHPDMIIWNITCSVGLDIDYHTFAHWEFNGKQVGPNASPRRLGMKNGDELHLVYNDKGEPESDEGDEEDKITLFMGKDMQPHAVRHSTGEEEPLTSTSIPEQIKSLIAMFEAQKKK